jgi:hypothetical protein
MEHDAIPKRSNAVLLGVVVAFAGLVAFGVHLLSRGTAAAAPLAELALGEDFTETTLAAVPGGRLSFWTRRITEEGTLRASKVGALRYEIELRRGDTVLSTLACDPFRATTYLHESHSGNRHEAEHDLDDCTATVPRDTPVTIRARRVVVREQDGVRLVETSLVIRP